MKSLRWFLVGLSLVAFFSGVRGEKVERVAAEDVVRELQGSGVLVCFERVHNVMADAITPKMRVNELGQIPEGQRTAREQILLEHAKKLIEGGVPENAVMDWRQRRFDFEYPPGRKPEAVLDALIAADPDYTWERSGTRYLVYPKEGSFNSPLAGFKADNVTFTEFLEAVREQILKPSNLNAPPDVRLGSRRTWMSDYESKILSLTLGSTDSRTALTAAAEAIGPEIVWWAFGSEPHGVNAGFIPVRKQK